MSELDQSQQQPPPILDYGAPTLRNRGPNPWATVGVVASLMWVGLAVATIFGHGELAPQGALLGICLAGIGVFLGMLGFRQSRQPYTPGRHRSIAAIMFGALGLLMFGTCLASSLRSSERVDRVKCFSNLRRIGQSIDLYATEHTGSYPATLSELYIYCYPYFNPNDFTCPSTNDEPASGPTTQAIAAAIENKGHQSYIYLGNGLNSSTVQPSRIIAHEPLDNHEGEGIHVLLGDGQVDWLPKQEATRVLKELKSGHNPPRPVTQPAK
jgi:hypothetical protein